MRVIKCSSGESSWKSAGFQPLLLVEEYLNIYIYTRSFAILSNPAVALLHWPRTKTHLCSDRDRELHKETVFFFSLPLLLFAHDVPAFFTLFPSFSCYQNTSLRSTRERPPITEERKQNRRVVLPSTLFVSFQNSF